MRCLANKLISHGPHNICGLQISHTSNSFATYLAYCAGPTPTQFFNFIIVWGPWLTGHGLISQT